MISMSKVQDIRRMRREGESIAGISRATGVSEPTVRKHLKPQDLSPKMPARTKGPSVMDEYASTVDSWLEADQGVWHKQRHTAQRVWECDCSSGVAACGVRNGIKAMAEVSRDCWTGNLGAALSAAGFRKHTGSKYVKGDSYLGRGWVLLNEGAHTAICVSDGANYGGGSSGGSVDGRSVDELARAVISGKFGNGDA